MSTISNNNFACLHGIIFTWEWCVFCTCNFFKCIWIKSLLILFGLSFSCEFGLVSRGLAWSLRLAWNGFSRIECPRGLSTWIKQLENAFLVRIAAFPPLSEIPLFQKFFREKFARFPWPPVLRVPNLCFDLTQDKECGRLFFINFMQSRLRDNQTFSSFSHLFRLRPDNRHLLFDSPKLHFISA